MTRLQGVLVSGAAAARYAAWLGLDRYLLMELKGLRQGWAAAGQQLGCCWAAVGMHGTPSALLRGTREWTATAVGLAGRRPGAVLAPTHASA